MKKYQSVTHVSISIFEGLFIIIFLRYVALVTKKLWAFLDFFQRQKSSLNYYSLKITKFPDDSVKNESARTKKQQGGGAKIHFTIKHKI